MDRREKKSYFRSNPKKRVFCAPSLLCDNMDFGGRRLPAVDRFESRNFLFDLASPLRVFLAELVRDPIDLEAFELAFVAEFITCAVAKVFNVSPEGRLVHFARVTNRLDHVMGLERVAFSFWCYGKIWRRKVCVNMRIERPACIVLEAR